MLWLVISLFSNVIEKATCLRCTLRTYNLPRRCLTLSLDRSIGNHRSIRPSGKVRWLPPGDLDMYGDCMDLCARRLAWSMGRGQFACLPRLPFATITECCALGRQLDVWGSAPKGVRSLLCRRGKGYSLLERYLVQEAVGGYLGTYRVRYPSTRGGRD